MTLFVFSWQLSASYQLNAAVNLSTQHCVCSWSVHPTAGACYPCASLSGQAVSPAFQQVPIKVVLQKHAFVHVALVHDQAIMQQLMSAVFDTTREQSMLGPW